MKLIIRTMRGGYVYKFKGNGEETELRRYRETYRSGEDDLLLESSVSCSMQMMIELMNSFGILRWNGFHGKHPRNVNDGKMFIFTATVNDGQEIFADGSENFPKGYHEFVSALDAMLQRTKTTE